MSNTLDVNALNLLQRHTLFCANINFLAKITCELYFEKTVYTTVGGGGPLTDTVILNSVPVLTCLRITHGYIIIAEKQISVRKPVVLKQPKR